MFDQDAEEIRTRFQEEQRYIERYVSFVRSHATVWSKDIKQIQQMLEALDLPKLAYQPLPDEGVLTKSELQSIVASIQEITPLLDKTIRACEVSLRRVPKRLNLLKFDEPANVIEMLGTVMATIDHRMSDESLSRAREKALEQLSFARTVDGLPTEGELVDALLAVAYHTKNSSRLEDLTRLKDSLAEIEVASRISATEAEVSLYRQGFILLMTAFDAAVFDLARVALRRKFFELIGAFGRNERISLDRIGSSGSFEALRDQIVEQQLRIRYLKDLMIILRECGMKYPSPAEFGSLVELVQRRNLHVHNRGIVDERYLDRDERGTPRYNVSNLKAGEVATITMRYWAKANRVTAEYVNHVAAWVQSTSD